ncbi:hypothetical protein [Rhodopseudomonas sp. RCAM05734]|uniref:hypothetical protein n=1 Tax=Rhodopseudomonas sp. RCAM05734 TaxID=3457549 RepID=UPI004044B0D8
MSYRATCWIALLLATPAPTAQAAEYYKVQVTRKAQDLYLVDGQNIYVKTRYCYEYSYSADAILQIDSPSGYNIGEIIFVGSGGSKCDVERLLR